MPPSYPNSVPFPAPKSIPPVSVEVPETKREKQQVEEQKVKILVQEEEMLSLKVDKHLSTSDFRKLGIIIRISCFDGIDLVDNGWI